jgi:hypothetical protein
MSNRDSLTSAFVAALAEDYAVSGQAALERVRAEAPEKYLALVAQLVPKAQPEPAQTTKYDDMTMQELRENVAGFMIETTVEAVARRLPEFEALIKEARRMAKREGYSFPPLTPKQQWIASHQGQYVTRRKRD